MDNGVVKTTGDQINTITEAIERLAENNPCAVVVAIDGA
jgi:hypothetical protein